MKPPSFGVVFVDSNTMMELRPTKKKYPILMNL
jgi:hypothetical protein